MKKRMLQLIVPVLVLAIILAGCGGNDSPVDSKTKAEAPSDSAAPERVSNNFKVTITNGSSYIFNELYVSPTAAESWGEDHLGSTSILKKNGSFDITLQKYDFNTYDIKVIDEDEDAYLFSRVALQEGATIVIGFSDSGLVAEVTQKDGTLSTVSGTLQGVDSTGGGSSSAAGTGYETSGEYGFNIYNESSYDIYAIYMGLSGASSSDDVDVLPQILEAGESIFVSGTADSSIWEYTDWTLYVVDVDNDSSASYETFNPWLLTYVNITWSGDSSGYVCEFVY
ncbi:hypothetical protein LJC42_06600 [Eubacteriales bacterium OttesenSCG-928-K08]|nr:hypothetical protein [Eubacteriales bacterium OttesenSCG-928-K08]